MATPGAIAQRAAAVHERVRGITARLVEMYALVPAEPVPAQVRKHPQLGVIAELEQFSATVEAGLGAALTDLELLKQENAELREELARLRSASDTPVDQNEDRGGPEAVEKGKDPSAAKAAVTTAKTKPAARTRASK